ncbi:hypothetical protein ABEW03_06830, partial [Virgibacillus pantothenticus]|uniref:hypothetical protein n=1 Tax=Virgibacillus pantothenticus TaxID=1473 RepID=UPI003D2E8F19
KPSFSNIKKFLLPLCQNTSLSAGLFSFLGRQKPLFCGIFSSRCSRRSLPILTTLKLAYTQLAIYGSFLISRFRYVPAS